MKKFIALILLLTPCLLLAAEERKVPDYSREKLTLMFRDTTFEEKEMTHSFRFPVYEIRYRPKMNPYLAFAIRAMLITAPLPGTTMKNGSLTPVIDPFEMTGTELAYTPRTFRDRWNERKLRRQLDAQLKVERR